ncbi:MAG: CDP-alcohol phosphatidyltransferase family protein [Bacilli bacterium]|nr:CDP-alcohol phosphatidyltransferase family protein [Bacilli bacterium]
MIIGKWNKSVILSYIGLFFGVFGIYSAIVIKNINYAMICLILTGICDMFDGTVARRCKRTEEEKEFGIQLDSLNDVFNFAALPILIFCGMGLTKIYDIIVYCIYAMFAIARLANFNIRTANANTKTKYYEGLPVTSAAVIFPIFYLLSFVLSKSLFNYIYIGIVLLVGVLFVLNIKVAKPSLKISILFLIMGLIATGLFLFVL